MELLPFFAGKEIPEAYLDEYFFNRKKEIKELVWKLERKPALNIAIYGKRRLGKTSLMEKVKLELKKKHCLPILLKCEKLLPLDELTFLQNLALELIKEHAKIKKLIKIKEALKNLPRTKVGLELEEITFWLEFGKKTITLKQGMDKCFHLIELIAKTSGKKVVLFLDEFQELFVFGDAFLWALRAHISDSQASFVVSSSWHQFKGELTSEQRPFFNFFDSYEIGDADEEDARTYLETRIKKFNYQFQPEVVNMILSFSECKPYYLQLLALKCYMLTLAEGKKVITSDIYDRALKETIKSIPAHLLSRFTKLKGKLRDIFVAMCVFDLASPTRISEKINMPAKNVIVVLGRLIKEHGLVEKNGQGKYYVEDKFLKEYVKQEFSAFVN